MDDLEHVPFAEQGMRVLGPRDDFTIALDRDGAVLRAALGLLGMGSTPLRAPEAEQALLGRAPSGPDLDEVAQLAVADLDPPEDIHATARYRQKVGAHLTHQALQRAIEEARSR